jgi:hypothetical protein
MIEYRMACERENHIHIKQLPEHLDEVPQDQPVHVFCGSGSVP